jgi:hypothetical protein
MPENRTTISKLKKDYIKNEQNEKAENLKNQESEWKTELRRLADEWKTNVYSKEFAEKLDESNIWPTNRERFYYPKLNELPHGKQESK